MPKSNTRRVNAKVRKRARRAALLDACALAARAFAPDSLYVAPDAPGYRLAFGPERVHWAAIPGAWGVTSEPAP